jgi:hypothetical protein
VNANVEPGRQISSQLFRAVGLRTCGFHWRALSRLQSGRKVLQLFFGLHEAVERLLAQYSPDEALLRQEARGLDGSSWHSDYFVVLAREDLLFAGSFIE